jgi:hypothetical protein
LTRDSKINHPTGQILLSIYDVYADVRVELSGEKIVLLKIYDENGKLVNGLNSLTVSPEAAAKGQAVDIFGYHGITASTLGQWPSVEGSPVTRPGMTAEEMRFEAIASLMHADFFDAQIKMMADWDKVEAVIARNRKLQQDWEAEVTRLEQASAEQIDVMNARSSADWYKKRADKLEGLRLSKAELAALQDRVASLRNRAYSVFGEVVSVRDPLSDVSENQYERHDLFLEFLDTNAEEVAGLDEVVEVADELDLNVEERGARQAALDLIASWWDYNGPFELDGKQRRVPNLRHNLFRALADSEPVYSGTHIGADNHFGQAYNSGVLLDSTRGWLPFANLAYEVPYYNAVTNWTARFYGKGNGSLLVSPAIEDLPVFVDDQLTVESDVEALSMLLEATLEFAPPENGHPNYSLVPIFAAMYELNGDRQSKTSEAYEKVLTPVLLAQQELKIAYGYYAAYLAESEGLDPATELAPDFDGSLRVGHGTVLGVEASFSTDVLVPAAAAKVVIVPVYDPNIMRYLAGHRGSVAINSATNQVVGLHFGGNQISYSVGFMGDISGAESYFYTVGDIRDDIVAAAGENASDVLKTIGLKLE